MKNKKIFWIFFVIGLLFINGCSYQKYQKVSLHCPTDIDFTICTYELGGTISWGKVDGATSYNVYIEDELIENVNSNIFTYSYDEALLYENKNCQIQATNGEDEVSVLSPKTIIPSRTEVEVKKINFNFDVTKQNDESLLIKWQAVSVAKNYVVYIDDIKYRTIQETEFVLSAVDVFNYNNRNISIEVIEEDARYEFIPMEYTIVAPVLLTKPEIWSTNVSDGSFKINWNTIKGANSYNIYIDGSQYITGIQNTSYVFDSLHDYTNKNISIRAVDIYGRLSEASNDCVYQTIVRTPIINAEFNNIGDLVVTWEKIVYAKEYILYWRNDLVSLSYITTTTTECSYKYLAKDLLGAQKYEIFVVAKGLYGENSGNSNVYSWSLKLDTPVINVTILGSRLNITWTAVYNAVKYEIYFDKELIDTVEETSYNHYLSDINQSKGKKVTVVAVTSQGVRSKASNEYVIV